MNFPKQKKGQGRLLFIRDSGKPVYELEAIKYRIKNNPEYKEKIYIDAVKKNNQKVMSGSSKPIWKKAYKSVLNIKV